MEFSGGQALVDRLLKAYGFSTQRELVEKIGVGHGTVSTWIRREYFAGEAVVQCALDTGVSLEWLATGKGEPAIAAVRESEQQSYKVENLPFSSIDSGHLQLREPVSIQASLLPSGHKKVEIIQVPEVSTFYLVDKDFAKPTDGIWITQRADVVRCETLQRTPGNHWRIEGVDWPVDEVKLIAKVIGSIKHKM